MLMPHHIFVARRVDITISNPSDAHYSSGQWAVRRYAGLPRAGPGRGALWSMHDLLHHIVPIYEFRKEM